MKVYQKKRSLSSEARELISGAVLGMVITVDMSAFPCFVAFTFGVQLTSWKFVLSALFAAQIAVVCVTVAVIVCKVIRRARRGRCVAVLGAQEIRRIMEGRR